jgi:superfamily II DNA or RNA helicase
MQITENIIIELVGEAAYTKARSIVRLGKVLKTKLNFKTNQIDGSVRGSAGEKYKIEIDFDLKNAKHGLSNHCSCPVGLDCKHVAAVLLQVKDEVNGLSFAFEKVGLIRRPAVETSVFTAKPDRKEPAPPQLSAELELFLKDFDEDAPIKKEGDTLLYYNIVPLSHYGFEIEAKTVKKLKSGNYSTNSLRYRPQTLNKGSRHDFVTDEDVPLLARLLGPGSYVGAVSFRRGEASDFVFDIINTGRAYYNNNLMSPLIQGEPLRGEITWEMKENGEQLSSLKVLGATKLFALNPPLYYAQENGVIGIIETDFSPKITSQMLAGIHVKPAEAKLFREKLQTKTPNFTPPKEIEPPIEIKSKPKPRLTFKGATLPISMNTKNHIDGEGSIVELSFNYEGHIIEKQTTPLVERQKDGKLYAIKRNMTFEKQVLNDLAIFNIRPLKKVMPRYYYYTSSYHKNEDNLVLADEINGKSFAWENFLYDNGEKLKAKGFDLFYDKSFKSLPFEMENDISGAFTESSGIDWFDLSFDAMIDGVKVDLSAMFVDMIRKMTPEALKTINEKKQGVIYGKLPDGRSVALPFEKIAPLLNAMHDILMMTENVNGKLRVNKANIGDMAIIEAETGLVFEGGENLRAMGKKLREGGIAQVLPPDSFKASLRPYQQQGVNWLQFLRETGFGGILADDMGLGKTVQTLAHITIEKAAGRLTKPVLIIAPTSVVANWRMEAERFTPDLKVLILRGLERKELFDSIPDYDIVISTYPLMTRDHEILTPRDWSMMVLDEAQSIKNPLSIATQHIQTMKASQTILLSGTPMENHLGELWSLFTVLSPGFLGDKKSFTTKYRNPIEKLGNKAVQVTLAKRVRPFMLRRGKEEVAKELPPKTEMRETVEMEGAQKAAYESVRFLMHKKVRDAIADKGLARSHIIILDALLKLRQICCDPRLLLGRENEKGLQNSLAKASSAKLERLMEMLPTLIDEGRKILLFSQFTSMLALIRAELDKLDIPYVLLQGDTKDRETPIREFQAGKVPLFLISLKAGGVGLNLTAADTVIHYDPWWNPAVENQATDRAHRIGQTKPVFVHKMVTLGTIEEKMEGLKAKKAALAAGLFDESGKTALNMSEADINDLFM